MIDALHNSAAWAVWSSCCQLHSWFIQENPPGSLSTPLVGLPTTTGYATDGTSYFSAPAQYDLLELVTRSGLMDGLTYHSLASNILCPPPLWMHAMPQPLPQWNHPHWVQHLHPDIKVTNTLTFCYRDVYVTLDPWAIETCINTAPVALTHVGGKKLNISDLGYTSRENTYVDDALQYLP